MKYHRLKRYRIVKTTRLNHIHAIPSCFSITVQCVLHVCNYDSEDPNSELVKLPPPSVIKTFVLRSSFHHNRLDRSGKTVRRIFVNVFTYRLTWRKKPQDIYYLVFFFFLFCLKTDKLRSSG